MKEGLIVLQFWQGDRDKAMRLAKFIADIEPKKRDDIDFMFMARADCSHDRATANYVARKFNVGLLKPQMRAVGHPWACWVMLFSILEWLWKMKQAGTRAPYKWVLAFEPDCVPISKTWLDDLKAEWNSLNAYVVGSETFHWQMHLNGNAMYSCADDFLQWFVQGLTIQAVPQKEPYDIWLFPRFAQWGVGYSRKIANRCGQPSMTPEEAQALMNMGLVFVHGVKDDSLFHYASTRLLR